MEKFERTNEYTLRTTAVLNKHVCSDHWFNTVVSKIHKGLMHLYDNKSLRVSRAMGTQQTITASAWTHEQKNNVSLCCWGKYSSSNYNHELQEKTNSSKQRTLAWKLTALSLFYHQITKQLNVKTQELEIKTCDSHGWSCEINQSKLQDKSFFTSEVWFFGQQQRRLQK